MGKKTCCVYTTCNKFPIYFALYLSLQRTIDNSVKQRINIQIQPLVAVLDISSTFCVPSHDKNGF